MKSFKTIWSKVKWPVIVLVVLYVGLVIYRIPALDEKERTTEAVAYIHAQKITRPTVEGTNLPPQPYKPENDATVAGLDKNNNNIRDDVELAIFAKYPKDAKIRAAELQYAMAQQLMITKVFNTETWKAAAVETSRGFACIGETISPKSLEILEVRTKEVEDLIFNTTARSEVRDKAYTFTTSYGLPNTDLCNVDLASLSN